eukprot:TsM_001064900 transcript=TsM_001064900 gene=TsM_001064900
MCPGLDCERTLVMWKCGESWPSCSLDACILSLLFSSSVVKDTKMWATALVVAYLRTHMASRKEEWEMVVQKAVDWLKATCPDPEALIEKAKKALEKLVPKP